MITNALSETFMTIFNNICITCEIHVSVLLLLNKTRCATNLCRYNILNDT